MDLDAVRTELEQMVRETEATHETLEDEGADESSELSHADQHPADLATDVSELDRENALIEATDERHADALAALARLDAGTYGVCVDCGQQIAPERLEFRPEAARCLDDQAKLEAAAG